MKAILYKQDGTTKEIFCFTNSKRCCLVIAEKTNTGKRLVFS